ncbi:PucR family transcriptional regulator [Streptomyces sp. NPDC020800]|uniref:PucR family transcriptional regulator n=1 Tax=Streptomyces sp. NPDC020800 TaxID=3365092 RepID=UPI0037A406E2
MQAMFRTGARLALNRAKRNLLRRNLPAGLMLAFADSLLVYVDQLVTVSRDEYLKARAEMEQGQGSRRQRLLEHLLSADPMSQNTLLELADQANWQVPETVTLIAFAPDGRPDREALPEDVLVNLRSEEPHALIPGCTSKTHRQFMDTAPHTIRAAVGLPVPLSNAVDSLRWARRALNLVELGVLPDVPYTYCAENLVPLCLFADPGLVAVLANQQLAPLTRLSANQRDRFIETLGVWLDTQGNAVQMAQRLHLHPQTVRYRLRNLKKTLGDKMSSPDRRFALEMALRSLQALPAAPSSRAASLPQAGAQLLLQLPAQPHRRHERAHRMGT